MSETSAVASLDPPLYSPLLLGCVQPGTGPGGDIASGPHLQAGRAPLAGDILLRSPVSLVETLEVHCGGRFSLPSPPSFPLHFPRCQTCIRPLPLLPLNPSQHFPPYMACSSIPVSGLLLRGSSHRSPNILGFAAMLGLGAVFQVRVLPLWSRAGVGQLKPSSQTRPAACFSQIKFYWPIARPLGVCMAAPCYSGTVEWSQQRPSSPQSLKRNIYSLAFYSRSVLICGLEPRIWFFEDCLGKGHAPCPFIRQFL